MHSDNNKYEVINDSVATYYNALSYYDVYRYCILHFGDLQILLEKILDLHDIAHSQFNFFTMEEYEYLEAEFDTLDLKKILKELPDSAIKILFYECFDTEGIINYGKPYQEKDNLVVRPYTPCTFINLIT